MIKEIKINSTTDTFDSLQCSHTIAGDNLPFIISEIDKCCGQYCIIIDVVESDSYATYKYKLRQISILLKQLTKRESEILWLVIKGMPNKGISKLLNISVETVKSHRKKIVSKIGLQKVTDLLNILYDIFISKTLHSEIRESNLHSGRPIADSLISF
jgi:DNA-binding CsgD family transcriptional regulator